MVLSLLLPAPAILLTVFLGTQQQHAEIGGARHHGDPALQIPDDWVLSTPGSCNVVISSPHGGSIKPGEIGDRTNGCLSTDGVTCRWDKGCSPGDATHCRAATGIDSYTQEVAASVVQHLADVHGCAPHFVRSNLHRSKLDPNRPIEEAAQGDPLAQAAWRRYHDQFMVDAVETVRARFGRGLVLDIHGQSHAEQWTEIGYAVSKADLNSGIRDLTGSSIRGLAARSRLSPQELVSGLLSFGSFLESAGYKTVPSPSHPSPGNGGYFSGGYITQRYGSRAFGEVDAVQVEIASGLRMDPVKRQEFARELARAVDDYRTAHGYRVMRSGESANRLG